MADLVALAAFLRAAKRATYAGDGPKVPPARPNSEDYHFAAGPWAYHDCYWGASAFIGHEVVWFDGRPFWGMNYYGGPVAGVGDVAPAYAFLKLVLCALDGVGVPVRGPDSFSQGDFTYSNALKGDLAMFEGVEEIRKAGELVCRHIYHGGLIT